MKRPTETTKNPKFIENITVRQDSLKLSLENTPRDGVCSKVVPGLPEVNPQNTKEQTKR